MKPCFLSRILVLTLLGNSVFYASVHAKSSEDYEKSVNNEIAKYVAKRDQRYLKNARKEVDRWIDKFPIDARPFLRRGEVFFLFDYTDSEFLGSMAKVDWDNAYRLDPTTCVPYWEDLLKEKDVEEARNRLVAHYLQDDVADYKSGYRLLPDRTLKFLWEKPLWDEAAKLAEDKTIEYLRAFEKGSAGHEAANKWLYERMKEKGNLPMELIFARALWESDPESSTYRNNYIVSLVQSGSAAGTEKEAGQYLQSAYEVDPEECLEPLKTAMESSPRPAGCYYLALISAGEGKWVESLQWVKKKIEQDPGDQDAQLLLGRALLFTGDVEKAINSFESLRDKSARQVIYPWGLALYLQGKYAESRKKIAELDPSLLTHEEEFLEGRCLLEMAKLNELAGDVTAGTQYAEASETLERALALLNASPQVKDPQLLAEYEDAVGDAKMRYAPSGTTLHFFELAMFHDNAYAPAGYHRGDNYLRKNQVADALAVLSEAIERVESQLSEPREGYPGASPRRMAEGYTKRIAKDLPSIYSLLGKADLMQAVDAERKGLPNERRRYLTEAITNLQIAVSKKSDLYDGHLYLGYAMNMDEKRNDALNAFENARQGKHVEYEARYGEAWMKELLMETEQAAIAYGDCLALALGTGGQKRALPFGKLCSAFLPVASIDPGFSQGRLLFELGDREQLDREKKMTFYRDADKVLEAAIGRFKSPEWVDKAIQDLAEIRNQDPGISGRQLKRVLSDSGWRRGVTQRELGNRAGSLATLEKATQDDDTNDRAWSERSRTLIEDGTEADWKMARQCAKKAVELASESPRNLENLSWAYYNLKMYDEAVAAGNRAISLDEGSKLFPLARVIVALAHAKRASQLVELYEVADPDKKAMTQHPELCPPTFLEELKRLTKDITVPVRRGTQDPQR